MKNIKHNLSVVAENHDRQVGLFDRLNVENKCFELPDGSMLSIDPQIKYTASEICFK